MNLRICLLWLNLALVCTKLMAQDANYWNSGYSAGGYLMPGAVVSNNKDSGVLFYNPALLVHSKILMLSANATLYHINTVAIKNGAGTGYDLISTSTGSVPLMVAGNVKLPFKKPVILAYGIIQPEGFSYAATQRRDDTSNVLNDSYSPGKEIFVGQFLNQNISRETNIIASIGWGISKHLSVGISLQMLYRTQTINFNYYARALVNPGAGSNLQLVSNDASYYVDYGYIGLLGKIGFAWEDDIHHAGILVTLPNTRIGGTGTLLSDNSVVNIITEPGTDPLSFLANTRQQNLKSKWKTPWSVAFGYTHDFENWQLYVAAEYFGRIKNYNVITPRPEFFIRGDSGVTSFLTPDLLKLQDGHATVLNWSVGASYHLHPLWSLYGTFRSDYSYVDRSRFSDKNNLSDFWHNSSYWDLYNVQFGLNTRREKFNARAGVYFNFGGTGQYPQTVNLSNVSDANFLEGDVSNTKAHYSGFGIILSYIHNF